MERNANRGARASVEQIKQLAAASSDRLRPGAETNMRKPTQKWKGTEPLRIAGRAHVGAGFNVTFTLKFKPDSPRVVDVKRKYRVLFTIQGVFLDGTRQQVRPGIYFADSTGTDELVSIWIDLTEIRVSRTDFAKGAQLVNP